MIRPRPPAPPAAGRSLGASRAASSSASPSVHLNPRVKVAPTEGPVWLTTEAQTERELERHGAGTSQTSKGAARAFETVAGTEESLCFSLKDFLRDGSWWHGFDSPRPLHLTQPSLLRDNVRRTCASGEAFVFRAEISKKHLKNKGICLLKYLSIV